MSPSSDDPATLRSAISAVLTLPVVVAFVLPLAIAAVDPYALGFTAWGLPCTGLGIVVVAGTVREFFTQGRGTLAPWDPPRHLVTTGLFARCRNPMYVGVLLTVFGDAWTFRAPIVAAYGAILAVAFHVRVLVYEEPWAARTFPDEWPDYRARVPRWLPRVRHREPDGDHEVG